jgi:Dolichyl-phosphate-mannose-protein mannosyltransferase
MNNMDQNQFLTRFKSILHSISWGPWLLVASGIVMANISWLKWPDLVIDFGEQAYIAWRLSEGTILYRDIAYFYGPLSSYVHALLFKLFGSQLIVLIIFNLVLVAVLAVLIYRLFLFMGSRLSATSAGLIFLTVFAFAQYLWMGNHNFICSYVYDVTHGIFLSFLAAGQFVKFAETRQNMKLVLLGLLSGLVLLTKIEVSLAWTTAVLAGLFLLFKTWNCTLREWQNYLALFCLGLFLPFLLFTFYFAYHMGWSQGLQAMLSPWTYVFSTSIGSLSFYKGVMGTDALSENLTLILKYLFSWALFLAMLGVLNHALRKPVARFPLLGILLIILFLFGLHTFEALVPWLELLRPLPFVMLGYVILLAFRLWNRNNDSSDPLPTLVLTTMAIFSTVLLLKIFFKTHVYHYGTALAMPATLIFFKILIDDLPSKLREFSEDHLVFKGAMIAGMSLFVFNHILVSAGYYGKKVFPVVSGGDTIVSYNPEITPRALFFQITLDILNKEMNEGETLAAFPTGTLLNYLSRKENPINSISYNPGTWKLLGEQRVLKDLQASPPTYIAIVYHDFLEFGYRFFGKDFGKDIYQWISEDYASFKLVGKDPVKGEGFGIHLFKLKNIKPDQP